MFNRLNLNGIWKLSGYPEGEGKALVGQAKNPEIGPIDAAVPGEVHLALMAAALIPDPFYGTNRDKVGWVEEKEWWYSRTFEVPDGFSRKKTILKFDSLNGSATVWVNEREVGRAENTSVPQSFDVTGLTNDREFNTVTVRVLGAGISRSVNLISYDQLAMSDVHVQPAMRGRDADAWIYITVDNFTSEDVDAQFVIVASRGDTREKIEFSETVPVGGDVVETVVRLDEPELWYPNGTGDQPLYAVMVGLSADGEIQDVCEEHFGVRSVRLVEEEAGEGQSILSINGRNVFCKGANWIPADYFPSRATPERYRELLQLAANANINLLRVRGGGVYEDPNFYHICDELGIMVRQDLTSDAADAVKSLRNHPSVVLWCGEESDTLSSLTGELDGTRPYRRGDTFDESAAQGPPVIESVRDFIPEDQLFPPTLPVWEFHSREKPDADGEESVLVKTTVEVMGDYSDAEEFVRKAGVLQGESLKAEIERCRRMKWQTTGCVARMYNDCWPAISSSIVDYYGRPKVAYYYVKRAFEPVIVSFAREDNGRVSAWVTSDILSPVYGTLEISLLTFGEGSEKLAELPVTVEANSSRRLWSSETRKISDPSRRCLTARLSANDGITARNTWFFEVFRNIGFPDTELRVRRQHLEETRHRLMIGSNEYARTVAISNVPRGAVLSDNYFDLFPDEGREIIIDGISGVDAAGVKVELWTLTK